MNRSRLHVLTVVFAVALVALTACAPTPTPAPPTAVPKAPAPGQPTAVPASPTPATARPSRPIEFVISTTPGGGSDIYARAMQGIIEKRSIGNTTYLPVNRPGGAGAVAFQYVFERKGDMHYVMITLNSFFTTVLTQKGTLPFAYKDFTPIANLALDPFFLWVPDDSPWKTAGDFVTAAKADSVTVGGTGSKQEDEILFYLIQVKSGVKAFKYVPFEGGGAVAAALAGKQVQATVNNPSEGLSLYQAAPRRLRPICTFQNSVPTAGPYKDLATCKSQGLDVGFEYFIMRSVLAPPGLKPEEVAFHVNVFKQVFDSPEWKAFAETNVLDLKFLSGAEFTKFLDDYNKLHEDVMKQAGWIQ